MLVLSRLLVRFLFVLTVAMTVATAGLAIIRLLNGRMCLGAMMSNMDPTRHVPY